MKVGEYWMERAAEQARRATCERDRCGAVVMRAGKIVGAGFNGPVRGFAPRCATAKTSPLKPKSDRTCCVHAEWRALLEATQELGGKLRACVLFFTRVERSGEGQRVASGLPYCTVCSRLAHELGLEYWVLDHGAPRGLVEYTAAQYDEISHEFDLLTAWQSGQRVAKRFSELPSPLWLQEDAEGRVTP